MIKAIITDLDDTLLRFDKTVSRFTLQTLGRCRENGVKLVLATARSAADAARYVPPELFDGIISMNGADAAADNVTVYERQMSPGDFIPFLKAVSAAGIQAAVEIGGVHCSNFDVPDRNYRITDFSAVRENQKSCMP